MFGGILTEGRAGVGVGRFGASAAVSAGGTSTLGSSGAGVAGAQRGAPYAAQATSPTVTRGGIPAYQMLLGLVGLEVVALVGLRRGFRNHHGG